MEIKTPYSFSLRSGNYNSENRLIFESTYIRRAGPPQPQFDEIYKRWNARVTKEFYGGRPTPLHYVYVGKYSFNYWKKKKWPAGQTSPYWNQGNLGPRAACIPLWPWITCLALYFFSLMQTRTALNSTSEMAANWKSWKNILRDFTIITLANRFHFPSLWVDLEDNVNTDLRGQRSWNHSINQHSITIWTKL